MLSLGLPDPSRWPAPGPASTSLGRCVLLALLLHLLLVLLVGNVPGGSARPGQGVWGSINVTLRGGGTEKPTGPPAPELPPGPVGAGDAPRWGGAVRERAPEESAEPGAARVGEWAERTPAPALPAAANAPSPLEPLAMPELRAPELQPAAAALRSLQAAPAAAPAAAPLGTLAPVERVSAPSLPPSALPTTGETPVAAPAERQLGNALPAAPDAPPSALGRVAPLPGAPSLPSLNAAPALAAPVAAPVTPVTPAAPVATAAPSPGPAPPSAAAPAPASTASPAPVPGSDPITSRVTSPTAGPDAGPRAGHDQAVTPSTAASMPRLNLALPRLRGGELSIAPSRGALPVLPRPPELKSKLESDLQKAGKPDCRDKYAGMGVLAVVPLAAEAVRADSSCRW
jgi:hypothetical protein